MNIGDVIRCERKKQSLTQSELAERIGVSTQAVSKWETGVGMPDVSQIVLLARELRVTTDRLFDFKDRYNELNREWQSACFAYEGGRGSIDKLIEIEERALSEYPDDYTFLYRRAIDKYRAACEETDERKKTDVLRSAEGNAVWALSKHPDDDGLISVLVKILSANGEHDRALEYAYKSKHKDSLLKIVLKGEELRRHRQRMIEKKLHALLSELSCDDLDLLRVEEDIIRAIIPDGNYVWLYDYLAMAKIKRAKIYASEGKFTCALDTIGKAFYLAREKDERRERKFTAPLFDTLDPEREDVPSLTSQIRSVCEKEKTFAYFADNEEYKSLLSEAEEYCRERTDIFHFC